MKRLVLCAALALVSVDALAVGRAADLTITDRDSGRTLPTYYYRGEYWVAGSPGARYAIRLRSHSGERLLAVMAVDGINVVSGETAGWGQTGYVFAPYQDYDVTGWRKSNSEVAAFEFAAAPDSYAARTGRGANVGVIGVALFRERIEAPPALAPDDGRLRELPGEEARDKLARRAEAAPAPPAAKAGGAADSIARLAPSVVSPSLGTAHGQREGSYVEHTEFTRRQPQPDEVIRIRYDSRENLVALGVIRERSRSPAGPDAFPQSRGEGFVPDPPGYSGRGLR